jgi:ketosteroid isomerase-like protein
MTRTGAGVVWLGLVCVMTVAAQKPEPARTDPETLEGLERQLVAAIGARDLTTYDRLVADDYVVVNASGEETTKAQVMARYRSGERGYTAVVSARTDGLRHEGGRDVPNRVRYLRVYARRNAEWRAVAQMSTPMGEATGR